MALIYQPSKRIFCGWFEPLKSTTYSEYPYEKDGAERYVTEIIAEQIQLLRSKKDNDENPAQAKPAAQRRAPEPAYDSDVPF